MDLQIHDLPFSLLTKEVALSLGATLDTVIKPADNSELQGGNFVLVRVVVDTSKPLSRSKNVSWDKDKEGWVSYGPTDTRNYQTCVIGAVASPTKTKSARYGSTIEAAFPRKTSSMDRGFELLSSTVQRKQWWRSWDLTNLRVTEFKERCRWSAELRPQ